VDRQYSRNLETGEGIELIYLGPEQGPASAGEGSSGSMEFRAYLSQGNAMLNLQFNQDLNGEIAVRIYDLSGRLVQHANLEFIRADTPCQVQLKDCRPGCYVVKVNAGTLSMSQSILVI
jgi:hypothetical protein